MAENKINSCCIHEKGAKQQNLQLCLVQCVFKCMKMIHIHHKLLPNSSCLSYQVRHEANWRRAEFELLVNPQKPKIHFQET